MKNTRARAASALAAVLGEGSTLDEALALAERGITGRDRALLREIAYGCCRRYDELDGLLSQLLQRPLKARDVDVRALLLVGLYQLRHMRVPDHAAVAETVAGCAALGKPWARGLVNAVLRGHQARAGELSARLDHAQRLAHPLWLVEQLEEAWPDHAAAILAANNAPGPLSLRVNRLRLERAVWMQRACAAGLDPRAGTLAPDAVVLGHAVDVAELPGFAEGEVSVQDQAAQLAACLLDARPGQRVLDACAAPGGKSCHLLESVPGIVLTALDISALRLARIEQNLSRLGLQASLRQGDASQPAEWWDGSAFERILVDAPCSGSGVIRRHPDIKLLRTARQVREAAALQQLILLALWPCLAPGGTLLYCTCSVLPEENETVIRAFLAATPDARESRIDAEWGLARVHGRQLLPEIGGSDGFFYVRLHKCA